MIKTIFYIFIIYVLAFFFTKAWAKTEYNYLGETIYDNPEQMVSNTGSSIVNPNKKIDNKKNEQSLEKTTSVYFKYGYGIIQNEKADHNEMGIIKHNEGLITGFSLQSNSSEKLNNLKINSYNLNLGYQLNNNIIYHPFFVVNFGLLIYKDTTGKYKGLNLGADIGFDVFKVGNISTITGFKINEYSTESSSIKSFSNKTIYLGIQVSF